jgi:protein-S-isoprenylcysteine O-methyltransferase Ste14
MKFVLFAVILVVNFLLLFGVAISALFPKFRIWPPPRRKSWQFWISWVFSVVDMGGVALVGILDLETLGYIQWSHFLIRGLMILIGGSFACWGTHTLSMHQSLGLRGKLVTNGPYKFTRNPQYLGFILLYAGVVFATSSFMALVTGTIIAVVFVILPFSEEPWLLQQYGKPYEEYCKKSPRFIGLRSFRQDVIRRLTNFGEELGDFHPIFLILVSEYFQ